MDEFTRELTPGPYLLSDTPLASGGNADVFAVADTTDLVVKILHQDDGLTALEKEVTILDKAKQAAPNHIPSNWGIVITNKGQGLLMERVDHTLEQPIDKFNTLPGEMTVLFVKNTQLTRNFEIMTRAETNIASPHQAETQKAEIPHVPIQLSLRVISQVISQTAQAITALAKEGIFHRDIKPNNIGVYLNPLRIVLLDFGVSLTAEDENKTSGTPLFMSPEQAINPPGVKPNLVSEIYSLAVTSFVLICENEHPFFTRDQLGKILADAKDQSAEKASGLAAIEILRQVATESVWPARRIIINPESVRCQTLKSKDKVNTNLAFLNNLFKNALAYKPEDRYQDAVEFAKDLEYALKKLHDLGVKLEDLTAEQKRC